jgi:hypothetical protein
MFALRALPALTPIPQHFQENLRDFILQSAQLLVSKQLYD